MPSRSSSGKKFRISIINCAPKNQELVSYYGKSISASQILAMKIRSYLPHLYDIKIHRPSLNPRDFPEPGSYDCVIIPGSRYDIDEAGRIANPWMEDLLGFIKTTHKDSVPMLGICFGHQAIAVANGSKMMRVFPPQNVELGLVQLELTRVGLKDPIMKGIPKKFCALEYHFRFIQIAPKGSVVLSYGPDKIIQSFRFGKTWGVQFHPDYNLKNVREMVERQKDKLSKSTDLSKLRLPIRWPGERQDNKVLKNFINVVSSTKG